MLRWQPANSNKKSYNSSSNSKMQRRHQQQPVQCLGQVASQQPHCESRVRFNQQPLSLLLDPLNLQAPVLGRLLSKTLLRVKTLNRKTNVSGMVVEPRKTADSNQDLIGVALTIVTFG